MTASENSDAGMVLIAVLSNDVCTVILVRSLFKDTPMPTVFSGFSLNCEALRLMPAMALLRACTVLVLFCLLNASIAFLSSVCSVWLIIM